MLHPTMRIAIFLLLSLGTLLAFASEPVGRVLLARGDVTATGPDGAVRVLARRGEVREFDVIETGAGSVVQVRFDDGATVELRSDSRLVLAEYRYNRPDDGPDSVLMEIFAGAMRAISGVIGGEQYEVKTPVASIGIRGTHFETAQEAEGTWVYGVWDGGIALENDYGSLDLGADAGFLFARAMFGQAPVGLVSAPAALGSPTAGSSEQVESAVGGDGSGGFSGLGAAGAGSSDAALAGPGSGSAGGLAAGSGVGGGGGAGTSLGMGPAINPAEGVGSEQDLAALQEVLFDSGFQLTEREQAGLASGRDRGILLLADGRVVTGLATTGDDGGPLFLVELDDGGQALIRGGGALVRDPSQNVGGFDVSWGSFAADEPSVFIGDGDRVTEGVLADDLGFLMVEASQLADLTVRAAYAGEQAFGTTSAGEITDFGVFFDAELDLGSGRITDGHLLLEAGDGLEEYRVNFAGRVTEGEALLGVTQGTITGSGIDGTLDVDRDLSELRGLFTAGGEGFAGGFTLQEAGNAERFARGGFVAEKIGDMGAPTND